MEVLTDEKRRIIEEHLPFAYRLAAKFQRERRNINLEREDFEGAALVGLCEAARNFDPSVCVNFSTFSYLRIRGAMYELLRKSYGVSRSYFSELTNSDETSENETGARLPYRFANDVRELAKLDVHLSEYGLNIHLNGESDKVDISYSAQRGPELEAVVLETKNNLRRLLQELPAMEQKIIEYHYYSDLSYSEMSELLGGMSKSWISRMHKKALDKLRYLMKREGLSLQLDFGARRVH